MTERPTRSMRDWHDSFVRELGVDFDPPAAAVRCGSSAREAADDARRMMLDPEVLGLLEELGTRLRAQGHDGVDRLTAVVVDNERSPSDRRRAFDALAWLADTANELEPSGAATDVGGTNQDDASGVRERLAARLDRLAGGN